MKLDWRRVVLYLAVVGIEGCWLYALMALLNRQAAGGRLSVIGIMLLYPLSFILGGLLRRLRVPEGVRRAISGIAWAAATLLCVKIQLFGGAVWSDAAWLMAIPRAVAGVLDAFAPELLVLIGAAVVWWLGRRLAYLRVGFGTLVGEFQFGLIMLVFTVFIASVLKLEFPHLTYLAVAFFLFSLMGISVAHALEGNGWLAGANRGYWTGLLLASIGIVLVVGFIISIAVTPELLQMVLAAFKWVWGLVMKALVFFASLFPEPELAELPPGMAEGGSGGMPDESGHMLQLPEALKNGLRLGWMLLFAGFLLVALWRISSSIFRWWRRRLTGAPGAEFESLPGALRADLLNFIRRIYRGLLRLLGRLRPAAPSGLPEAAPVRQIYRQFLRWAGAAGWQRSPSQTPHEYLVVLAGRLPEVRVELDYMTQQYVRARYGARGLSDDELYELRQSWYNVKHSRPGKKRRQTR